ncbi:MAG TPA: hypothetical protein VH595_03785 [Verrucomicrobiae bacterium]|jgi:hypothetical protein|nr:hypothetical protein [Verrucomicrobiae bacterium]
MSIAARKNKRAVKDAAIRRARGILKRKPGQPSSAEEWAEYKREERKLERSSPRSQGKKSPN